MGLFKRFTGQASKAELEGFKSHLKYGDDPMVHWEASKVAWETYKEEQKATEKLLRKILKPKEVHKISNYSKMEINIWSHKGKCKKSPIGEHVYIHHYGDNNPKSDDKDVCMCCEKTL